MHSTNQLIARRLHDGQPPPSWLSGDTQYQKAAVLAALAWHEVKPSEDPELTACDLSFRESCIGIAESIIAGNEPDSSPFAHKALEIWKQTPDYIAQHPNKTTALEVTIK